MIKWAIEVATLTAMGKNGMTLQAIANHYGVSKQAVSQALKKHIPKWNELYGWKARKQKKLDNLPPLF